MPPSIIKRLEHLDDLPPMPNTMHMVLQEMESISSNSKSLEKIIMQDPMLAAKILKIANSPLYGVAGQVNSISHAVTILGFDEVKNLIIGLSLIQAFGEGGNFDGFSIRDLWLHSIGVATASMLIAKRAGNGFSPDECFTMGLLHDIGRFILCKAFAEEVKKILKLQEEKRQPLSVVEEEQGFSHSEVGAYLAQRWKLSEQTTSVVRYHHRPRSAGEDEPCCAVVYLADQLCHKLSIGWSSKWLPKGIMLPKSLSLKKDDVQELAREIKSKKDELAESWASVMGG